MMSIEKAEKATKLAARREKIVLAKFSELVGTTKHHTSIGVYESNRDNFRMAVDEQLSWAIEEFRKRKLDEIDEQIRKLGFEPPQMQEREQQTTEPKR
jgi:hypothetical protein